NKKSLSTLRGNTMISRIIFLFTLSVTGSYLIVNATHIDFFRILFDPLQIIFVFLSFLLFSLPFFFSGLVSVLAYSTYPQKAGMIYFISMTGSTIGALLPILSLPLLDIGGSIFAAGVIPLFFVSAGCKRRITKGILILFMSILTLSLFFIKNTPFLETSPGPYKTLSQLLQLPGTYVEKTTHTIQGKIDVVRSHFIRYVPGLSLTYQGKLPAQYAMIKDADQQITFYSINPSALPDFPLYTLPYAGYLVSKPVRNLLIVQKGGGTVLPLAFIAEPKNIFVCEENPVIAEHISETYKHEGLFVINKSHREYIKKTSLLFDIIHIENWGSSIPGFASLTTEYLYTIEGMKTYIDILTDKGVLIIPRKLLLPPSDSLRIFLSAYTALKAKGYTNPKIHIMLIKHWDIYTLLVSKTPFTGNRLDTIKKFCFDRGFDLLYYEGITEEETGQFVNSKESFHYNELQRCMEHSQELTHYLHHYFLDISPQGDNRPYHNKYIKWEKLPQFYKSIGSRMYTLILSGEIIIWFVFGVALIVTMVILILPTALLRTKRNKTSLPRFIYFLAIGAGFMFMEIVFINEYTLPAGDHVISFSFVLCLIFVFSGIGGYVSSRFRAVHLRIIFSILISLSILLYFSMDFLVHLLLSIEIIPRFILMGVIMIPLSLLTGIPFPAGLDNLLSYPDERAYSWAANGCTSVLASIISVPVAMTCGIHILFLFGALAYGIALAMFILIRRKT
ncbi:MAG: hypothetical protein JXJ04_19585, partial [Spirochaetales bacterium]|nr:hypothetical protein [Spirochaetales bacterium]